MSIANLVFRAKTWERRYGSSDTEDYLFNVSFSIEVNFAVSDLLKKILMSVL